jgi:iron(III) transport system substrate-binding protein
MRRLRCGVARYALKLGALVAGVAAIAIVAGCCGGGPTVVVYTSLDQLYSEPILNDFEAETGIRVQAVYDVEAAKTTGLVNRLVAEKSRPQADVFWSSEYAQTIMLKDQGVLAPYDSPSAADIPEQYRDPEDYWTGFAARARIILVNTALVVEEDYPESIFDLLDPRWGDNEVGIANPLFGTTATHAAALFADLGEDDAQAYFEGLLDQNVRVVDGNSVVRDMVVSGELKVGLTDTDDAHIAVAQGQPVEIIFPDQDDLGTLLIPNTLALVNGAPHPEEAKRLVDYLLSAEVEAELAASESVQMPVREGVAGPVDMPGLSEIRGMDVHPNDVAAQMTVSAEWLKEVFLK